MRILVKSLQGDEYFVDVQPDHSILDLKRRVSETKNGPPVERQKFVFKGRTLQDSSRLSCYNLENDSKVHLILQKEQSSSSQQLSISRHNRNNESMEPTSSRYLTSNASSTTASIASSSKSQHQDQDQQTSRISSSSGISKRNTKSTNGLHDRFEVILRERLAKHLEPTAIEEILADIRRELDSDLDMGKSTMDSLEMMARDKLRIDHN